MKIPLQLYNFSMTHFSLYLTNMLHSKKNGSKSVRNLAGWNRKFLIPSKLETIFTIKNIWITIKFGEMKWNHWCSRRNRNISVPIIAPALTHIFNLSISKAEFPSPFKLTRVVPIHKKCPKLDYTNYRPISVLPITSLILERHVNLHLKAYLELNSLFQTIRL